MGLLILGAGMGIVGGVLPSPLHMIALAQAVLGRWWRVMFVLLAPPMVIDAAFLGLTFFFLHLVPAGAVHYVAYVGGAVLIGYAGYSLWELSSKSQDETLQFAAFTAPGISVASLAEVATPGNWIYWITIAGPILAEARLRGWGYVVPFFAGGLVGYYGSSIFSTWLLAWGAGRHRRFKQGLFLAADLLLLIMGISYFMRAYVGR